MAAPSVSSKEAQETTYPFIPPPLCWTHHPHYHPTPAMPDVPLIHRALVAAREGDLQGLQLLRKKQELLQGLHDDFGATCVHYAARGGHVKVLEFLMNKCSMRANVRSFVGATPAHDAAAMGKLPALVWLLRNTDCTLWDRDKDGATVLHIAARFTPTISPEIRIRGDYDFTVIPPLYTFKNYVL
ncbi:UNVERIFIED_CONTAM: Espin-like protein [Trichonephila clavipes]